MKTEAKPSLIWDMDGTLVDSYPAIVANLAAACRECGVAVTKEEIRREILTHSAVHFLINLEKKTGVPAQRIGDCYSAIARQNSDRVLPMEHAAETLEALRNAGVANYVFTHRGASAAGILKGAGLDGYFTEIVTAEAGFRRKPDPEGIDYLVRKYGLDRSLTCYVGDRSLDIECACNAGIKSILYLPRDAVAVPTGRETLVVRDLLRIPEQLPAILRHSRPAP